MPWFGMFIPKTSVKSRENLQSKLVLVWRDLKERFKLKDKLNPRDLSTSLEMGYIFIDLNSKE